MRQEAPKAADVSINYEQETLENKASCDLEYAASKDAQSWTTIRQGGKVRLTGLLNNIRENGGPVPVYIRKKASSSMSASEAVLVANLQTQAIPGEPNKPNIDYRKERNHNFLIFTVCDCKRNQDLSKLDICKNGQWIRNFDYRHHFFRS